MNATQRRVALYGGALVVLAGIGITYATVSRSADVMTLLSSSNVQLRLAHGMPAVDKDGVALTARGDLIDAALKNLADAERVQPGLASTAEFTGFAHSLRGDHATAADWYARAMACADAGAEQKDVLAFNRARMLAKAGQGEAALQCFAAHAGSLDARFGHQRALEEATILRQLGRADEARTRLAAVCRDEAASVTDRLQAGVAFGDLGDRSAAVDVLTQLVADAPFANYHLARLKLQQGEVDSSFDHLARAAQALPTEVKRSLREDADAWSAVAGDARYQAIAGTNAAAPAR
jgi:tetratricopeptide (TPR) repeat protein